MSTFLARVLLLAALCACALTSVSAQSGANITLYSDSACSSPLDQPVNIPLPFSPKCQSVPANPPISIIFNCVQDGKNTNFTLNIYNGTSDCSGDLTAGIVSDDVTGSCAATTITAQGQQQNVWSHIDCGFSSEPQEAGISTKIAAAKLDNDFFEDLIEEITEAMEEAVEKRVKATRHHTARSAVNTLMAKLHGEH